MPYVLTSITPYGLEACAWLRTMAPNGVTGVETTIDDARRGILRRGSPARVTALPVRRPPSVGSIVLLAD